ncbi:TolC family protein [Sediminicola luteus]|uniref:Transporter n=1 Tax=Sediminicola luteus TaxID=319238 RepID=A0A2A4GE70_9FLAO|nr:TolC family protein [Sediminicola luteus]PCE66280.1 transporter [Sediminicola luteus]
MKHIPILLLLLLGWQSGAQEPPLRLTLEEAITYGLENNRTAKNAGLDIEAAIKQKWETTTMGLPQLDAGIDYNNHLKQRVSLIPGEIAGQDPGTFVPVVFGTQHDATASASLRQLIFDGSYIVGLQSAKVFLEISENAKEKTDLEVRKGIISAYSNAILADETLALLKKDQQTLEKNLHETQKLYENGLTEEEDVEQLQITLAQITSNYNNAARLREVAYDMLNITLGNNITQELSLSDNLDALTFQYTDPTLLESPFALENNIDYQIAKNQEKTSELKVKLEKSKALPTLNAFLNAGYLGNNDEFGFLENEQRWFGFATLGLQMKIPIFTSLGRTAATQRAKINLEKAKNDLDEKEQQIQLELSRARSQYKFALEEYETSKKNLNLAQRIENKNQVKYSEGIATSFELRQAQTQLYAAQRDYLTAMVNVINDKASLEAILNNSNQ